MKRRMIFPLSITNTALNTINPNPVVPYTGSLFCVDARDFATTAWTGQWVDKVNDTPFSVGLGTPTVADIGGVRMVKTNGTARLERLMSVSNPHTVIFKGSYQTAVSNLVLVAGYGASQPVISLSGTTNFSFYAGTSVAASPVVTPVANTVYTIIASFNGASSAIWVNGAKTTGNAGSFTRGGIRFGANAAASVGYSVAAAHIEVVAGACSDAFAAQINADLA